MCIINQNEIPSGNSLEDIEKRTKIIMRFYYEWRVANPSKRVYNNGLKDYIHACPLKVVDDYYKFNI